MALGDLGLVLGSGSSTRFVGQGVSIGRAASSTARTAVALLRRGFNAANDAGTLRTLSLSAGTEPGCGKAVSFVTVSPVADAFAFVDGGVLQVARLQREAPRAVSHRGLDRAVRPTASGW